MFLSCDKGFGGVVELKESEHRFHSEFRQLKEKINRKASKHDRRRKNSDDPIRAQLG